MEQLANLNKRIRSVKNIRQMTKAMQLISSVKMRQAKKQLSHAFPFFAFCAETLDRLRHNADVNDSPYLFKRKKHPGDPWRMVFFVFSGDQGMAGSYILNLLHFTETTVAQQMVKRTRDGYRCTSELYMLGSVGRDRLKKQGYKVNPDFHHEISDPTYIKAMDLADIIQEMYTRNEADEIFLIYTKMNSALSMVPISSRLLPAGDRFEDIFAKNKEIFQFSPLPEDRAISKMEFRPNPNEVFDYLIDTYLNGMVYGALTEAFASEQTARMTAMDSATQNAEDMIQKLTIKSNQARQAHITTELSEIVGGASALTAAEEEAKLRMQQTGSEA